jgi:ubiquinone/menaquinone biosynthesis C-methylase UbiE
MSKARDRWAEWLVVRRFGGDEQVRADGLAKLTRTRDEVLDRADLAGGETVLDVGCGDGLIGFGALERGAATVIFSDISRDLLDLCHEAAAELDVLDRCSFIEAAADDLASVEDGLVDLVATRSVLIYVSEKARAFNEFARVLRPSGRISLWEPINRFAISEHADNRFAGFDLRGLDEIAGKLHAVYHDAETRRLDPMLDFDERDLIRLAEEAGFFPISLKLDAVVEPLPARAWEGFIDMAGNPNAPTLREAMRQALTPAERDELTTYLRPLVERGDGVWRMAHAHLIASKPSPDAALPSAAATVG